MFVKRLSRSRRPSDDQLPASVKTARGVPAAAQCPQTPELADDEGAERLAWPRRHAADHEAGALAHVIASGFSTGSPAAPPSAADRPVRAAGDHRIGAPVAPHERRATCDLRDGCSHAAAASAAVRVESAFRSRAVRGPRASSASCTFWAWRWRALILSLFVSPSIVSRYSRNRPDRRADARASGRRATRRWRCARQSSGRSAAGSPVLMPYTPRACTRSSRRR